jgi:hypothetical protein
VSVLPKPDVGINPPMIVESPSLFRNGDKTPAFELKFLLTAAEAAEVERRLRPRLAPDPYADPGLDGGYRVTSVYFDTPGLDVFHRSKGFRRRKYRVRRYGTAATAFLERKLKKKQQVCKRRTDLPLAELAALAGDVPIEWPGAWFAKQLASRGLQPVCRVSYQRVALVGNGHDGPIRVTFDRSVIGGPATDPLPQPVSDGQPILNGDVIVEFKFIASLPVEFKDVVEDLRLAPRSVSKYRRCIEAIGRATENGNA